MTEQISWSMWIFPIQHIYALYRKCMYIHTYMYVAINCCRHLMHFDVGQSLWPFTGGGVPHAKTWPTGYGTEGGATALGTVSRRDISQRQLAVLSTLGLFVLGVWLSVGVCVCVGVSAGVDVLVYFTGLNIHIDITVMTACLMSIY